MKRYCVILYSNSGEVEYKFDTDSPKTALKKWIAYATKRPTMAAIFCGSKEDCWAVYKVFVQDSEIGKYWFEKRCPYNYKHMYNETVSDLKTGRLYFSGRKDFYDQVPKFSLG